METLTQAEKNVAFHISAGYSAKETAEKIYRSVYTIGSQLKRIYKKLEVRNSAEMSMKLTLKYGDLRKFIAVAFIVVQSFSILNIDNNIRRFKTARRCRTTKTINKA